MVAMIYDSHNATAPRLFVQLRGVIRYKYDSLRTEEAYLYWVRFFHSLARPQRANATSA